MSKKQGDLAPDSPANPSDSNSRKDDSQLESIRSILLAPAHKRIQELEQEADSLRRESQSHDEKLQQQIDAVYRELDKLRQTAQFHEERAETLQAELDRLRTRADAESRSLVPRIIEEMSGIISNTISSSRDKMAEALGPVMGDAIRVQIRDSRDEMVDAIYPIILQTVQRALSSFVRELQRNIDARLRISFSPRDSLRALSARLRGISPAELALRESLPFEIEELFLIQHESGLLLAHGPVRDGAPDDSDVISGMLTAIRDFAQDSFGQGSEAEELDEIQYGDQRIIIQSGQYAYLAAVIAGIEPRGFRDRLQELVSKLHIHHKPQLRDYDGDSSTLPDLQPELESLTPTWPQAEVVASPPLSRGQRWFLVAGGISAVLVIACACFYLQFTLALLPVAFGATSTATVTATATATQMPSVAPTQTPSPTATLTPSATRAAPTATATPTATPTATATEEATATSSPTPAMRSPRTTAPVWVRSVPDIDVTPEAIIAADTPVTVRAQFGPWVEVEWQSERGSERGWIPVSWLDLSQPIPSALVTPLSGG